MEFFQKKRNILILVLCCTIVFVVYVFAIHDTNPRMALANDVNKEPRAEEKKQPITLLFVGDMMADRGVRRKVEHDLGGEYAKLFENIPEIGDVDIAFGNLEGPVAGPSIGRLRGSRFSFRMSPDFADALSVAGFDVLSFANNHVGDYGDGAFLETLRLLDEKEILYAGAGRNSTHAQSVRIIEKQGLKIGFIAFSDVGPKWMEAKEDRPGQLIYRKESAESLVHNAKSQVDILFVSIHWGSEYSTANKNQENIAKGLIDAGADGIIGHHPHVMQKIGWYNEKPIFYSLGNFIFDQYFSPHTMRGMVVKMTIDPYTKKISAEPFVTTLSSLYVPQKLMPFNESMLITKTFTP